MTAAQALKKPYFKELRDLDRVNENSTSNLMSTGINSIAPTPSQMSKVFKMNNRQGNDSLSMKSKSLSKISDNNSEGSYLQNQSNDVNNQGQMTFMKKQKKKTNNMMYGGNMKKGPLATQHHGYFADFKNDN